MFKYFLTISFTLALMANGYVVPVLAQPDPATIEEEAHAAVQKRDFAEALTKFERLNELVPNQEAIEVNIGFCYIESGRSAEAIPHLVRATEIAPTDFEAWSNLVSAYQSTNQPKQEIDALEHVIKLTKDPKEKEHAEASIKQAQQELKEQVIDTSKTDYLKSVLAADGHERWSADRQPVKVYIADGTNVPNYKPEFLEIIKKAFAEWQEASGDLVKFQFVPTKEGAPIDVRFVADRKELRSSAEAGECLIDLDGKGLAETHIAIGVFDSDVTPVAVHCIALHEIGHACGLAGHSQEPDDIMYSVDMSHQKKVAELTPRDKETIRKFYTADIEESWLTLADRGTELTDKHEFKAAAECFEKALKKTSEPSVKTNLARLHFTWGQVALKDGDTGTAETHFKTAFASEKENPDLNYDLVLRQYAAFLRQQKRDGEAAAVESMRKK